MGRRERPLDETNHAAALLGKQLRQARQEQDITLSDMAHRIGYSKTQISRVEHGTQLPSQQFLAGFANVLGTPLGPWLALRGKVIACLQVDAVELHLETMRSTLGDLLVTAQQSDLLASLQHVDEILSTCRASLTGHEQQAAFALMQQAFSLMAAIFAQLTTTHFEGDKSHSIVS